VVYRTAVGIVGSAVRPLYRVRVEGLDNVPASGPAIIAANHVSFLDSMTITVILPRRITYLAKAEIFDPRFRGWIFRIGGQIPVDRNNPGGEPMLAGMRVLDLGGILGVHPEGTRSPDGRLYRGKTGVARLAHASGATVIPTGVTGSHAIYPKEARFPKLRGQIGVTFGTPVRFPSNVGPDDTTMRSFVDDLMGKIRALTGQEYVDEYSSRIGPRAEA
jgi:1-acyl-sn-glycerol-3-phosphate acyltransferase